MTTPTQMSMTGASQPRRDSAPAPAGLSWQDGLHTLSPDGWPSMVSARASHDVGHVAEALPIELTRAFYAEVRLCGHDDQMDVSIEITRAVRRAWGRWIDARAMTDELAPEADGWRAIRRLLHRWETEPALDGAIRELWIEFDRPVGCTASAPSCFVGFRASPSVAPALVLSCAATLSSAGLPTRASPLVQARMQRLASLLGALPRGVAVGQLGVLLARGAEAPLRLCLSGIALEAVDASLRQLHVATALPGHALLALLAQDASLQPVVPRLDYIDLDVGAEIAPRVGVELRCDRRLQARGTLGERAWLGRLAERALLGAGWIDALAAWPRGSRVVMPHELWPSIAVRRLNHIKLRWEHGEFAAAKGYCLLRVADAPPPRARVQQSIPTSVARHRSVPLPRSRDVLATVPS